MFDKSVICLVILVTISCSCLALNAEWDQEWVKFIKTHNKVYKNKIEEIHRRSIWEENMKRINEHNQNPKVTFSMKMNEFGDLTSAEFSQKYLNRPIPTKTRRTAETKKNTDIPDAVDWRDKDCVGPIVNQGQCGSSWGFGAAASLEGVICAQTSSKLVTLSVQQLVDCSDDFGNAGCNGGLAVQAFEYIKQYGLESNDSYPYAAVNQKCQYDASKVIAHCTGEVSITAGDEEALTAAIANVGPISIAVEASNPSFQFYSGGVYYEPACDPDLINHGVVTIGYGSQGVLDYYIVKNTWGTGWGDKGYIYMSRNRQNNCGIASEASYPTL